MAAVVVGVGGVALALTAFAPVDLLGPTALANQRFVADVQAQGHTVQAGPTEDLVVRAAQKLCERQDKTTADRHERALTAEEIEAVRRTFGDDAQAFMKVALRTYCP